MAAHATINSQSLMDVANSILEKHRGSVAPPMEDAIAHAVYLYGLPPSIQSQLCLSILWLYDEQGHPGKGYELYIHNLKSKNGPDVLYYTAFPVRFLSQKYTMDLSLNQNGPGFIPWLMEKTSLTDILRINKSGSLAPEFKFLLKWYPDRVCYILKDFWHQYQNDINHLIQEDIAKHMVPCYDQDQGGTRHFHEMPLKNTCIQSSELKKAISSLCNARAISMLPVKRVISAYDEWKFLSTFGVKVIANLDFYLWLGVQSQFKASCKKNEAKRFLDKIAYLIRYDDEKQFQARMAFNEAPLIYLPPPHGDTWVLPTQCAWDGPTLYTKKYLLKPVYGGPVDGTVYLVPSFIRNTLIIKDVTVGQVIVDLLSEEPSDAKLFEACEYIGAKIKQTPEIALNELESIRDAFTKHRWIPIPEDGIQVRSFPANCVWGGPKLNTKFNLESFYEDNSNLRHLFRSVLNIKGPIMSDLLNELQLLKRLDVMTCESIEEMYAYIFNEVANPPGSTPTQDNSLRDDFERHALVYTKGLNDEIHWCKPSDCFWDSTHIFSTDSDAIYSYTPEDVSAVGFLRTTLGIKNAGPTQYIEKLRLLQKSVAVSKEQVEDIYKCIERNMANQGLEIRRAFESESLVYDHVHKPPRWVSLSCCIWDQRDPSIFWEPTSLALCYPSLEVFFSNDLCVQSLSYPSLEVFFSNDLCVQSLNASTTRTQIVEKVKNLLNLLKGPQELESRHAETAINAVLEQFEDQGESTNDLEQLWAEKLWPCRETLWSSELVQHTRTFLVCPMDRFFIVDDLYLQSLFQDKVPLLVLEPKQVAQLRPVLLRLGLEKKFLSGSVRQTTSVSSRLFQDTKLTLEMRYRARALLFCAEHFNISTGTCSSSLEQLFNTIKVYRAADISITYELGWGKGKKAVRTTELLFFDADDLHIKIVVPQDENGQKEAFATCLPKEVIRFIGLPEGESWQLATSLLAVTIDRVKNVLNRFGIQNSLPDYSSDVELHLGGNQAENAPLHNKFGSNFAETEVPIFLKRGTQGATASQSTLRARHIVEPGKKSNMKIFTGWLSPLAMSESKITPCKPRPSAGTAVDSISRFDLSSLVSALDVPTKLHGNCLSPVAETLPKHGAGTRLSMGEQTV